MAVFRKEGETTRFYHFPMKIMIQYGAGWAFYRMSERHPGGVHQNDRAPLATLVGAAPAASTAATAVRRRHEAIVSCAHDRRPASNRPAPNTPGGIRLC